MEIPNLYKIIKRSQSFCKYPSKRGIRNFTKKGLTKSKNLIIEIETLKESYDALTIKFQDTGIKEAYEFLLDNTIQEF